MIEVLYINLSCLLVNMSFFMGNFSEMKYYEPYT